MLKQKLDAIISGKLKQWSKGNEKEKRLVGIFVAFLSFFGFDPYKVYERASGEHEVYFRRLPYYKRFGAPIFNLVMIQTTSICNRKCHFCYYGIEPNPENVIMADELFRKIIKSLVDIEYREKVALFEINEPFTDPQIIKRLEYAVKSLPKAWHHFTTNADLASFEQLVQVAQLVNQLHISSYDKASSERNTKIVARLKELNPKALITHGDTTLKDIKYVSRAGHIKKYFTGNTSGPFCEYVYQVMMITPKGEVVSCWNDFYHQNKMGDIKKNDLLEIWYGLEFMEYRARLSVGDREVSKVCSQCDYCGYNQWHYPEFIVNDKGCEEIVPRILTFRYPHKRSILLRLISMVDKKVKND